MVGCVAGEMDGLCFQTSNVKHLVVVKELVKHLGVLVLRDPISLTKQPLDLSDTLSDPDERLVTSLLQRKAVLQIRRCGQVIGVGVCLLPLAKTLPLAFAVMAFVGICSGFFVVPLDALLQREGANGVGAGSAIAIQNLFENLSMLALVSGYAAAVFLKAPVISRR